MASHRRGPWSQAEDNYLIQLVHTQGALNWVRVAQMIGSRSPKQCRERYHQNLKPSLNHEPISLEEGLLIERLVAEMGKRWAEIARRLDGRSDNAVKNWWNGSMNRRRRLVVRRRAVTPCRRQYDETSQPWSFARPRAPPQHTLTVTPNYPPSRGHIDVSLPSPSTSEVSRADSMDAAPSLVSDSGSTSSISPRVLPSAAIELPPLIGVEYSSSRRPSLPVLQISSNIFISEVDAQAQSFSARLHGDIKHSSPGSLPTTFFRNVEQYPICRPSQPYVEPRPHLLSSPISSIQLSPIQTLGSVSEKQRLERDSRMKLSSLLA